MEISTAINLTNELLDQYNLRSQGWTVGLMRSDSKRGFGKCSYGKKRITLSRHHVCNAADAEVIDTIRHEVAHAIAGPGKGHGPIWKSWARILGARPRSTSRVGYSTGHKFVVSCGICCKVLQKRHNAMSLKRLATRYHPSCGLVSMGTLRLSRITSQEGTYQPV